jgi:hypothetical protein
MFVAQVMTITEMSEATIAYSIAVPPLMSAANRFRADRAALG